MKNHFILLVLICLPLSVFGKKPLISEPIEISTFINQRNFINVTEKSEFIKLEGKKINPLKSVDSKGKKISMALAEKSVSDSLRLVQLDGKLDSKTLKEFEKQGYKICGYIPDNTYIIKIKSINLGKTKMMNKVRWLGNYAPEYRISDDLNFVIKRKSQTDIITVKAVFTLDTDLNSCVSAANKIGIVDSWTEDYAQIILEITLPISKINELANISNLILIEYAPRPKFMNEKAVDIMNVREMWDTRGFYGSNEIVAIADSGIDLGTLDSSIHDDFEDGAGVSRIISIHDLSGDGADDNRSGHGTHVAGSVLGNGKMSGSNPLIDSFPSSCYAGSAPKAKLVFQAIGTDTGSLVFPNNMYDLFGQAYADNAKIHQNSWGSPSYGSYTIASMQLDDFVYNNPDMLICFAAGNSGADYETPLGIVDTCGIGSPATAKNCLTVGGTENNRPTVTSVWGDNGTKFQNMPISNDKIADDINGMAASSSRGPCSDGRLKPDIVAPSTYIASTRTHANPVASSPGLVDTGNTNYAYMSGTSMATPLVSGAAAVLRNYLREERNITNPPSVLLKSLLLNGATDLNPGQYGTGGNREMTSVPNNVQGWGMINLEKSLFKDNFYSIEYWNGWDAPINNPGIISTNFVFVNTNYPAKFTLSWIDYKGSIFTFNSDFTAQKGGGLINDLDMIVIDPNGKTNLPLERNTNFGLFYNKGYNGIGFVPNGLLIAEEFTAPELPLTLSNIGQIIYNTSTNAGGDFATFVWAGSDIREGPGEVLFAQTNSIAEGRGTKTLCIPVNITITTKYFHVGSKQISGTNIKQARDYTGETSRTWENNGSGWSNGSSPDIWMHAYGTTPNYDHINNVEGIIINNPTTGTYRIEISARNIPYPPVRYSVAVSGGLVPEPSGLFLIMLIYIITLILTNAVIFRDGF